MATETIASDHTSTTDEQYVKQEKDEGIAEKIISLANEDEDKHDKAEDAQCQATPLSKTEGDEVKAELSAAEIEKSDNSPAVNTSAEDSHLKHDKVDDAQSPEVEQGDDKKAEPAVAEEKTDDSVVVADDLKEEKELVPDSQIISVAESVHDAAKCQQDEPPSTKPAAKETPQQLEKESIETDEEKQPKTADIPEAETIEKSSNVAETIPLTESEAEVVKQAEILDTSAQKEEKPEPDHVATEVQEKTGEPGKESQEKTEETEQTSSVSIAEPSAETNEKESNAIEEKTTAETLKATNNHEVESTETGKAEPVVTEVELEPTKTGKEEPVVTEVEPTETGKAETVVTEVEPTETGKAEPLVTEVEENQKEPEKQSTEQKEEEQSITFVIPEHTTETSDAIAVEEKTREPEREAEVLKETNNYEAGHTETEKAEPVVTEAVENQIKPEKQSVKQEEDEKPKTVTPKTAPEIQEQPGDTFEFHPPKNSDNEVVKDTGKSELEAILVKEEKAELLPTEVEEKPIEQLQVAGEDEETSKDMEIKQETDKSEGSLTIKDPKEEKTEKEEETNTRVDTALVSLNEEAQADPANSVEPSPKVEEKVVEEEVTSKEVAGVAENPEQASIDQESKAGLKEESEHCVPTGVEEKVVAAAAEDDKKELEAPDAVQVTSREAEVEIKNTDEENGAKTATTEVGSVKNDIPAVDDKKEGDADTKVDEISKAVSEPVRETLASKFEEKEEETIETGVNNLDKEQIEEPVKTEVEATKENDATKTSKDLPKEKETPAKPAQKQSNNIISKVKQSLVKAKKAITGKSPSSKNLSSDAKGDIKVK